MNKIIFTIGLMTFLFLVEYDSFATPQDSLLLFTKPGCSNCHDVKRILTKSGIYFTEKSLANEANAAEMLRKLAIAGFKRDIYLPVIFMNNKLYHPAYRNDTGLVSIPLQDVVDSIRIKHRKGQLNFAPVAKEPVEAKVVVPEPVSDCEVKVTPIYLVCAEFSAELDAKALMDKLILGGNSFAGMVSSQGKYKVFTKFLYNKSTAELELAELKKTYSNAYLLETP